VIQLEVEVLRREDVHKVTKAFQRDIISKYRYDKYIPKEYFVRLFSEKIRSILSTGKSIALKLLKNTNLLAIAILEWSQWDSKILNSNVAKLQLLVDSYLAKYDFTRFLKHIHNIAIDFGFDVIFSRVALSNIKIIQWMLEENYFLADILITLNKFIQKNTEVKDCTENKEICIDNASLKDEPHLIEITRGAYVFSHYYTDPHISFELAEKVYEEWIRNSLRGYADFIIVARHKGTVLGYVTCKLKKIYDKTLGIIDLIAVRKDQRGKGIGSRLIDAALVRLANKTQTIYVATQAQNISALRLYEKKGFRIISSEATLHKWLSK